MLVCAEIVVIKIQTSAYDKSATEFQWTRLPAIRWLGRPLTGALMMLLVVSIIIGITFAVIYTTSLYESLDRLENAPTFDSSWRIWYMFATLAWPITNLFLGPYAAYYGLYRLMSLHDACVNSNLSIIGYQLIRWIWFAALLIPNTQLATHFALSLELILIAVAVAGLILVGLGACAFFGFRSCFRQLGKEHKDGHK